jgi:hypothetical protein
MKIALILLLIVAVGLLLLVGKHAETLTGSRVRSESVHVGFVADKVALGQGFPPEFFGFPLSISFHRCSITRKNEKKTNHVHHRVAQDASRLRCVRSFCCGALHKTKSTALTGKL